MICVPFREVSFEVPDAHTAASIGGWLATKHVPAEEVKSIAPHFAQHREAFLSGFRMIASALNERRVISTTQVNHVPLHS